MQDAQTIGPEFLPTLLKRLLISRCQPSKVMPHSECKWNHRN